MEVGSKGRQEWGLDNSSQFLIDKSWNRKCAWWYPAGTGRNFNIDVSRLKRVEKGRFLLGSITLLILSCHIEALQIFKLEIGVKKDIVYKTINLSIWFCGCARVLPVHKHLTDSFQWTGDGDGGRINTGSVPPTQWRSSLGTKESGSKEGRSRYSRSKPKEFVQSTVNCAQSNTDRVMLQLAACLLPRVAAKAQD